VTGSFLPARFIETELGLGLGGSGLQLSAMQKVVLGWNETVRFIGGVGLSYSGGSNEYPDRVVWLNIDVAGVEARGRDGWVYFFTGGTTTAVTDAAYQPVLGNDCGRRYCGNARGEIIPQFRAGIGLWF
jgi:hypothetical protein